MFMIFAKKRVWILISCLIISILATVQFQSYICAMLIGIFSTLLIFSTVGEFLYRKALKRMAEHEALKRQWNENQDSNQEIH